MTTHTYTENAAFPHDLADALERDGDAKRSHDVAAREAEHDPAYVAYVNAKVKAALADPRPFYDESEVERQIQSW